MTPHLSHGSSRLARRAAACVALGILVASCGSDEDSASTTPAVTTPSTQADTIVTAPPTAAVEPSTAPSNEELCDDREALRSSVTDLEEVDLAAEGTNGLTAAVEAVQGDLTALQESAGEELQPQVQAAQDGIDELKTAADNLGSGGGADAAAALSSVTEAVGTLLTSLEDGACG